MDMKYLVTTSVFCDYCCYSWIFSKV